MERPETRRPRTWIILTGFVLLVGVVLLVFLRPSRSPSRATAEPGRNILLMGVADARVDERLLSTLTWPDVVPTAEGVGGNKGLATEVVQVAARMRHPPALYLRGLTLLAANNLELALTSFLAVPVQELPVEHLYVPYRLHAVLPPAQPNPFLPRLAAAVNERKVSPLIQARVMAGQGRAAEALKIYLLTDPATWASIDAATFRGMRMQAGLSKDTATMLQAALRAGRVPAALRPELVEIIRAPKDAAALEGLKEQVLSQMKTNATLRKAAATAATDQLEVRKKFAGRRYRELLDSKRDAPVLEQTDETVLLLTLSAATLREATALDRWSQELSRRFPSTEVDTWLKQIRNPAP